MKTACILLGGPDRLILDAKGKTWLFEDHPYCGPVVLTKTGAPKEPQPPDRSPLWAATNLWYAQGKRIEDRGAEGIWCVWDKPKPQKLRHLGWIHYELVCGGDDCENEDNNLSDI